MGKGNEPESIDPVIREERNVNSVLSTRFWKNELIGGSFKQKWMNNFNEV